MHIIFQIIFSLFLITFNNQIQASTPVNVITEIPTSGIVISSPGTYVLGNNITWHPSEDGQAILITSNNVILDLQGYTLASTTTPFNTIGIYATSVIGLTIKNGTIANMALMGIQCEASAYILIKHITIDGMTMKNTATYTVPVGILVKTSANVEVDKCKVKNMDVRTGSMAAIQMTETLVSKISDCHVEDLINRDGACTGIGHLACDIAEVTSCTIRNLQSEFINNLNTEGHTTIGIVPVASANLKISHCKISNIIGCCDDAHGISVFECIGALIKDCHVHHVVDGIGAAKTGAKATGIEIYASGVKVSGCSAKHITAINPQDKQATGFSCAQCVDVEFIKCLADNINVYNENGEHDPALGYGTGFGWAPDPRPEFIVPAVKVLYNHCTAKNCQVGFDTFFHINCIWTNLYSQCNVIPILNRPNSTRTLSCNPCSECGCTQTGCFAEPITVTIDNVAKNNRFSNVTIRCKASER